MENSLAKSFGTGKSKKSKSFDTQILHKNGGSQNRKRKGVVIDHSELGSNNEKKKHRRKEAVMGSLEKSHGDRVSLNESPPRSDGEVGLLFSLVKIPKQPRGFLGRKKSENKVDEVVGEHVHKRPSGGKSNPASKIDKVGEVSGEHVPKRPSGDRSNSANKIAESNGGVSEKIVALKGKRKLGVDGKKKTSSSGKILGLVSKAEDDLHLGVQSNGDASSSKKQRRNHRKRKNSEILSGKVEPAAGSSLKMLVDSRDKDEENLEELAYRMLSFRFDPSCIQSSSKSRSPGTNGLLSSMVSDEDFGSREMNPLTGSEFAPGDLANRVSRPRKSHSREDLSRIRRHFYEIFSRDVDPYWVVNRRIKVFWPLDESWYYGLVSDYNSEIRLHYIKYDDREEEWVDLHNERFKLLLLPSEVPHMPDREGDSLGNTTDNGDAKDLPLDSLEGNSLDSEPIISWVPRFSRRVKSSHPGSSKRHKSCHLSPKLSEKLSTKAVTTKGREESDYLRKDMNTLNYNLANRSSDSSRVEWLGGSDISRDVPPPVVYVRRRFRKKSNGLKDLGNKACIPSVPTMIAIRNGLGPVRGFNISPRLIESERLLWSVDDVGLLKLASPFVDCKKLKIELDFSVFSPNTIRAEDSWLIQAMFQLKYGTVMNMWPKVLLEILFVDNVVGLWFLLFEGSLKQAVEFVFLVIAVFHRPERKGPADMSIPVTSIKFKLSCFGNSGKQHVFVVYSFSEVSFSKWMNLISKLQQHCLLAKQLPLSECTYDNIKVLESGNNLLPQSSRTPASLPNEGVWKKSLHRIMPKGGLLSSSCGAMCWSPAKYTVKPGKLIPFALSFRAAPSFFLSLHMKLLMKKNIASIRLLDDETRYSIEHSEKLCLPMTHSSTMIQEFSTNVPETTLTGESVICSMEAESSKCTLSEPTVGLEKTSECSDHGQMLNEHVSSVSTQLATSIQFSVSKDKGFGLVVELPAFHLDERPVVGTPPLTTQSPDMALNMSDNIVHGIKVNEPRLTRHSGRNSLSSSHVRPGRKSEFIPHTFSSGPKKRRTQVEYSFPSGEVESSSKYNLRSSHRGLPSHRIRMANDKSASEVPVNRQRNKGVLACRANVLITTGEKGWREYGAQVGLESADRNEWKLVVKIAGTTKFSYKAYQFLQSGSANRYTHAMMWRGGKDWALEFPDRNQWLRFKEMHEECFNRNLRAASVKNIPIPGVCMIEEWNDSGTELPYLHKRDYFQQVETDAEMAMNPSRVLYDMDSEDETWISGHQKLSLVRESECEKITEELFERAMDMLEKVAFAQQRDDFQLAEIEEFFIEIGPMESIRTIHEYWRRKRLQKGMPLIRHLQPPLWERYEHQIKEWEQAVARSKIAVSSGNHGRAPPLEKPPMFAFCLKPRGLEMPNKGTKQRAHRRYPASGKSCSLQGDHDGLNASGRRSNGIAYYGDEKAMFVGNTHEYSATSPSFRPSARAFSPRGAGRSLQSPVDKSPSTRVFSPRGAGGSVQSLVDKSSSTRVFSPQGAGGSVQSLVDKSSSTRVFSPRGAGGSVQSPVDKSSSTRILTPRGAGGSVQSPVDKSASTRVFSPQVAGGSVQSPVDKSAPTRVFSPLVAGGFVQSPLDKSASTRVFSPRGAGGSVQSPVDKSSSTRVFSPQGAGGSLQSPLDKSLSRVFSPQAAGGSVQSPLNNGLSDRNPHMKLQSNESKNGGFIPSLNYVKVLGPCNQKAAVVQGRGVDRLNRNLTQLPNPRHNPLNVSLMYGLKQFSDIDDFRLRDATAAAQHARDIAKLKRDKAQKLLYAADLATHKAGVALLSAEALKAATFEGLSEDEDDDESTEDDYTSDDDSNEDDSDDSDRTR